MSKNSSNTAAQKQQHKAQDNSQNKLAIIAGTGFIDLAQLNIRHEQKINTPYGEPSSAIYHAQLEGRAVYLLMRHGKPHSIAPHKVNYRANLWALKSVGVGRVIAVNAVGAINQKMLDGAIILPDQIIDYSYGREHTFYDGGISLKESLENTLALCEDESSDEKNDKALIDHSLEHIDFTYPYSKSLHAALLIAAQKIKLAVHSSAVCGVTQGPRLETAAEITRMKNDGCDIVGMTSMPEAALARELQLEYASLALVVNAAAGLSDEEITLEDIKRVADQGMLDVIECIKSFLKQS